MSDEKKFGLSDLVVGDDLDVSLDNDTYQDQANPAPPAQGNYRLRALSLDFRKDKNGNTILKQGFPVFVIGMAEIVEGLGDGVTRKVMLYQDVETRPFPRNGVPVSALGDLTRSYGTPNWNGLNEGIAVLKEAFESNAAFTAQLDWSIYDKDLVTLAYEQLGIQAGIASADRDEDEKKLINAIYKAARVTGQRFFPYNPSTGRFSHVFVRDNVTIKHPVTGSSIVIEGEHRTFEARNTITRYYPAADYAAGRVKLGPANVKPAIAAAA
jgi:hypothetical protein